MRAHKKFFCSFNLPPLHIMKKQLIPEVVQIKLINERKKYVSQTDKKWISKLKFRKLSSTVGNFREREEEAAHLPVSIFNAK